MEIERLERIKSKNLLLKTMVVEDITEEYINWLNDFETNKFLEVKFIPQTRKSVEKYVRKSLIDQNSSHFGVFEHNSLRLIGTVTFNNVDNHHLSAAISFVIGHPEAKGKDYGTEAVHAATNFMLNTKRFIKVYGGYYEDNKAAEKVFQKNGYIVEGRLKKKLINYKGQRVDHIYVGILREDFNPILSILQ